MMNTDLNRKCTMCRRKFGSKSTKNRHMNQTHASMEKIDCICEEQFDELFMETVMDMISEADSEFGSSAGASNNSSNENENDVNQDSNDIIESDASQQNEYNTFNNSENSSNTSQAPNTDIIYNDESIDNTNMNTLGYYIEFSEENNQRSVEYIDVTDESPENQYKWAEVENKCMFSVRLNPKNSLVLLILYCSDFSLFSAFNFK